MSVVVVIPSRGRPGRAHEACQAIRDTAVLTSTSVVLVVDEDDPERDAYAALRWHGPGAEVTLVTLTPGETGDLVKATNTVALRIAGDDPGAIIGNLGDDHVARTPGWDKAITAALRAPGIAYGDDLIQGAHLPTAPFVSASIVLALGWYFPPALEHMYPDNALKDIGDRLGILRYLPDVVIEHMHPGAGKAERDEGYLRADESTHRDREAYWEWRRRDLPAALAVIHQALQGAA